MGKFLFPDEYYDSTYSINFKKYYNLGYRAVLFDIDNTLVPHDFPSDERAVSLIRRMKKVGLKICVISNNDEERVKSFADSLGIEYVYKAGKPLAKGYLEGMRRMGTDTSNTLFVGDQLFTETDELTVDFLRKFPAAGQSRNADRSYRDRFFEKFSIRHDILQK